jgi:cytoskeleton protein RodZ
MSQEDIVINGELLRLRREARGWVLNDMATRACMSVKQIRQLEEGGMSSFYSAAVKMTSAKKVGALLGLSAEEVFAQEVESTPETGAVESEVLVAETEVVEDKLKDVTPAAQEAAHVEVEKVSIDAPTTAALIVEESKSKASLWIIAGLFASALAVAAYMQPQNETVVEAAPPLQVLPADMADPASVASGADAPASSADVVAFPASATTVSSAPRVAASVAVVAVPVMVRPASASMATPAASTGSKVP